MNDEGGRYVMRKYPEYVKLVEFKEEIEILDIDKLNDIRS